MRKLVVGALGICAPLCLYATIGAQDYGYGIVSKGMGGTGVAQAQDGFTAALNPAGIAFLEENRFDIGMSLFNPNRAYTADTPTPFTLAVEPGKHISGAQWYLSPSMAWARKLNEKWTTGFAFYGNGGLGTNYYPTNLGSGFAPTPNAGVFGDNQTGIELKEMFLNIPVAYRILPNLSVGASALLTIETLKVMGLASFANPVFSSSPANVTGRFTYVSFGLGTKLGALLKITDYLDVGIGYQPKFVPAKIKSYQGLLPRGHLEIPSNLTAGVHVKPKSNIDVNVEFQRIWFASTSALGNLNTCDPLHPSLCLGPSDGAGFGLKNANVYKIGAEWKWNEAWALRAGYAYNTEVNQPSQVLFGILAPVVLQNHITLGITNRVNANHAINLSFLYVPTSSLKGANPYNKEQTITLEGHQYEIGASWSYRYD